MKILILNSNQIKQLKDEYVNKNRILKTEIEKEEVKNKMEDSVELSSQEESYEKYLDSIRIKQNEYEEFKSKIKFNYHSNDLLLFIKKRNSKPQ